MRRAYPKPPNPKPKAFSLLLAVVIILSSWFCCWPSWFANFWAAAAGSASVFCAVWIWRLYVVVLILHVAIPSAESVLALSAPVWLWQKSHASQSEAQHGIYGSGTQYGFRTIPLHAMECSSWPALHGWQQCLHPPHPDLERATLSAVCKAKEVCNI